MVSAIEDGILCDCSSKADVFFTLIFVFIIPLCHKDFVGLLSSAIRITEKMLMEENSLSHTYTDQDPLSIVPASDVGHDSYF